MYCICESHLRGDEIIDIPGYLWLGNNRATLSPNARRGSGGVGVLFREALLMSYDIEVVDRSIEDIIWLKITLREDNLSCLLLCVAYLHPPSSRGDHAQEFYDTLTGQLHMHWGTEDLLIGGDFNGRIGEKQDIDLDYELKRIPVDMTHNKYGDYLLDFLNDSALCLLNSRVSSNMDNFTCISKRGRSVVDYLIAPISDLDNFTQCVVSTMSDVCLHYNILPPPQNTPDHSIVQCVWDHSPYGKISDTNIPNTPPTDINIIASKRRVYLMHRSNEIILNDEDLVQSIEILVNKIKDKEHSQANINEIYQEFTTAMHNTLNRNVPYKDISPSLQKSRSRSRPYWNDTLKQMFAEACKAEKSYLRYTGTKNKKLELKTNFNKKRETFDKKLRQSERQYLAQQRDELTRDKNTNPRIFWEKLNYMTPGKNNINTIKAAYMADGTLSTDMDNILASFCDTFSGIFATDEPLDFATSQANITPAENDVILQTRSFPLNKPITLEETKKAIKMAKARKAVGIDNIPNESLKNKTAECLLHNLFALCFDTGSIPDIWKLSIIVPILKPGKDKREPNSYRGISLISTVAKIYNYILNTRLISFTEQNNIISDEQNGFRHKRSCLDHLYTLSTIIRNRQSMGLSTYSCFIDLAKAFDSVSHKLLMCKLAKIGVTGKMFMAISSMYENLRSSIRINENISDTFNINKGVRQGDTLSPTLFSIYINDLIPLVNGLEAGVMVGNTRISILLYADDIVLVSDSPYGLQSQITAVDTWLKNCYMKINTDKTKVVHFRPKRSSVTIAKFYCGGNKLETVSSYKYLGVTFNDYMDFKITADGIAKGSSRAASKLIAVYYASGGLSWNVYSHIYSNLVVPAMDYASAIWGFQRHGCCDTVQRRVIRCFMGVGKKTPLPAVESDMGWYPPYIRHRVEMARLWCRLCLTPGDRLVRRVFDWDCHLAATGVNTWAKDAGAVLDGSGLQTLHRTRLLNSSVKWVTDTVKDKMVTQFTDQWLIDVRAMPKLRTYQQLCPNFNSSEYCKVLPRGLRSAVARMRAGVFPIALETGRWRGQPVDERLCPVCSDSVVEDEHHFLCDCPGYNSLRENYFSGLMLQNLTNSERLNVIFSNNNIYNTSTFIIEAFKQRSINYR